MKYLYNQFHAFYTLAEMAIKNRPQWFAYTPAYGDSYGPVGIRYRIKGKLRLLDLGNGKVRDSIINNISRVGTDQDAASIKFLCDPNNQFSSGVENRKLHDLLSKYYKKSHDGTRIDADKLKDGQLYSAEDMDGPSEVVIWKNFTKLLRQDNVTVKAPSGGRKTRRKN